MNKLVSIDNHFIIIFFDACNNFRGKAFTKTNKESGEKVKNMMINEFFRVILFQLKKYWRQKNKLWMIVIERLTIEKWIKKRDKSSENLSNDSMNWIKMHHNKMQFVHILLACYLANFLDKIQVRFNRWIFTKVKSFKVQTLRVVKCL